jgi:hypothetical protein
VGRVVKVLSGDPSRGGMALDTEMSVKEGERFIVRLTVFSFLFPKYI